MSSFKPKTPYLAVDGIVEVYEQGKLLGIALIERLNEPFGLAIPGGFVDVGETTEQAVAREIKEEISVDIQDIKLLGVYSDPKRDSRFHTVSIVYTAKTQQTPKAADDAKQVGVHPLDKIPLDKLVFDHKKIIEDYLRETK